MKFFTVWPPNPSQRKLSESINLLLANEIHHISALKCFFLPLVYSGENLRVRLATQRKFLPSSTCCYLRLPASLFDQGLIGNGTLFLLVYRRNKPTRDVERRRGLISSNANTDGDGNVTRSAISFPELRSP